MIQVKLDEPCLVLAPMEGVLDAPLRALMTELGGFSFCVSEFLRISQEVPPSRSFFEHLPEMYSHSKTLAGTSVQLQLLGGDPEKLSLAALRASQLGCEAIDLNFGCPARIVNRHDGGATLLKYPERILKIVSEVRKNLSPSVALSVKMRLGWDDPNAIHLNAEMVAEGGASWITIHGRTRMQGYQPPAFWKPIGEIRKRLNIPIFANGEIWTLDDFKRCRDQTGCQHFMLGRGALANPRLSLLISEELGIIPRGVSEEVFLNLDWLKLFQRFILLSQNCGNRPNFTLARLKQWARMIHYRFPTPWFDRIKTLNSVEEVLDYMKHFFQA